MKILSWNVNGLERCRRRGGFLQLLERQNPDIVCCQEIKNQCVLNTPGYYLFWNPAKRKNYSGTLILSKKEPLSCCTELGIEELDEEGRLIVLEYKDFFLLNVYAPSVHPHSPPDRLDWRLAWDKALREFVADLSKPVIMCGDFNATVNHLDIYPENQKNSPEEPIFTSDLRAGLQSLIADGYVDVYRAYYPLEEGAFTWWGPRNRSREENRGSRLDYFLVSQELIGRVRSIKHHIRTPGSDHCPISVVIGTADKPLSEPDEDLAVRWKTIDWTIMEEELFAMQTEIADAADLRDWKAVRQLQDRLARSYAAKVMAVRAVADTNSAAGIDGVRLKDDAQKMRMALSLSKYGYHPLPTRYDVVRDRGKNITLHIPAAKDKCMLVLYAYTLDPVAEATADKRSFFSRKGRSAHDAYAHLVRLLDQPGAPGWIVKVDVQAFFDSVLHTWLVDNIPMDKEILKKFLSNGTIKDGEFYESIRGISFASSLSPILGNMMLDGLQGRIYDRLYPRGGVDYDNGCMTRFADDMVISARDRLSAELIMQIVEEFLAERGLRVSPEKTGIFHISEGFSFLSWTFKSENSRIEVKPAYKAMIRFEHELEELIMDYHGSQRGLIDRLNNKLGGWAAYHRNTDSYMLFRHVDALVEGILVTKMVQKYARWHRDTILKKFWIKQQGHYVFALPNDPTCHVMRLAPLAIVRHEPCRLSYNPYLDQDYMKLLKHRRDIQKANGKYGRIWSRQAGRCAYCGLPMLADQEVMLVEQILGKGWTHQNLLYIHTKCRHDVLLADGEDREPIDLFEMLTPYLEEAPIEESPYLELREFFRLTNQTPLSLTFEQIEKILGDALPIVAYLYDAFWLDTLPGMQSPLWREEGYPFDSIQNGPEDNKYCISECWLSQGYVIKALHRSERRIVFRRVGVGMSGVKLPKALTTQKLPDHVVYRLEKMLQEFVRLNGL